MTGQPTIQLLRLHPDKDRDIPLPGYMTQEASGMDIHAAVDEPKVLAPGEIALIPTGFAMALPSGFEAQIRPRSGLAVKYGIGLINSPGTIDADYRGEVKIAMINHGKTPFTIHRGDRIAQMVIGRCYQVRVEVVGNLGETERNSGGFGQRAYKSA